MPHRNKQVSYGFFNIALLSFLQACPSPAPSALDGHNDVTAEVAAVDTAHGDGDTPADMQLLDMAVDGKNQVDAGADGPGGDDSGDGFPKQDAANHDVDVGAADPGPLDAGDVSASDAASDKGSEDVAPEDLGAADNGPEDPCDPDPCPAGEVCVSDGAGGYLCEVPVPCGGPCPGDLVCINDACVPHSARPIHPLSTSMSTNQRPYFQVALTDGADGVRIEVYTDHACSDEVLVADLDGDQGATPEPLAAGVYYWRATALMGGEPKGDPSLPWQLRVGHASAGVNTSWGTMFDLNLDGYADGIVGGCGISSCTQKVFIHHGGPDGLSETPTQMVEHDAPYFGFAVASAGDVNGDGYPDLVVGAGFGDSAHLFLSGPAGVEPEPVQSWAVPSAFYGFSVASAGDVNGDGYGDVVVGAMLANTAFVYYGGPEGPGPSPDLPLSCPSLGACAVSVSGAGDFNGDRFSDVVVGSPGEASNQVFAYHGGPSGIGPDPVLTLQGAGSYGTSVDVAGDVNGDGYIDVVVGAPEADEAHVYFGGPGGLSTTGAVSMPGAASYGISVSAAGDINGDGLSDVVIGAKFEADVWLGDGIEGLTLSSPMTLTGTTAAFADSVAGIGDADGDGLDDILIGATDEAKSYLYFGSVTALMEVPSVVLTAGEDAPGYGFAVANLQIWPAPRADVWSGMRFGSL